MDALSGFLDGPRARGAFLLRSVLTPPWSMRIEDRAPLTAVAVARGTAWIRPTGATPEQLGAGDLALVRGPDTYVVADGRRTAPRLVIGPGQVCTTLRGEPLAEAMGLGVRTWGNDPAGDTVLLTGTYQHDTEVGSTLLRGLPPLIVVRRDEWDDRLVDLLAEEITHDRVGQQAVLDRLLDVILVGALRHWTAHASDVPPWLRASDDPQVVRALELVHNLPAQRWTVAELARSVGLSRAAFARRFAAAVGEPPMSYLSRWRLTLAADLLRERGATVTEVARTLGYSSPYAFSAAYKRHHGTSPTHHRRAA